MSQRERDRLAVLRQVEDGLVTVCRGAERLGLTARHFRRLRHRWAAQGDGAIIHGLRGRRSNRAKPRALRERVLERARDPLLQDFGPTLLAEHVSREERAPGRLVLIQMHDDATNRLLMARFVPRDTGAANRQIAIDYLRRWGRPVAFYTDQAGHFGQSTRPVSKIPLAEREAQRTQSIIHRALRALDVELILAHSPQAKGRVERNFGTSQDRLVKELRLARISTLEEGNRFLDTVYVPYWNARFAVEPADARDTHRTLSGQDDLEALFAETWTRSVANDFTIRFQNRRWQIPGSQAVEIRPGHHLTVERRLDGTLRFRFRTRYLDLEPLPQPTLPRGPQNGRPAPGRTAPSTAPSAPWVAPPRPGPDHPWRKNGRLIASPRALAQYRASKTLAQPPLSAPSHPRDP